MKRRVLPQVAFWGVVAVLLVDLARSLPLQRGRAGAFLVLGTAALAVAAAIRLAMRSAGARLRSQPGLLVPLGIVTLVRGGVDLAARLPWTPALPLPAWRFRAWAITGELSARVLFNIAVAVVYAAWTTALIRRAVQSGDADAENALAGLGRWFGRILGFELIGWGAMLALLAVTSRLLAMHLVFGLLCFAAASLWWSFRTAAVLPAAFDRRRSFGAAWAEGMRLSRLGLRRWWGVLLLQMLLLGLVIFYRTSSRGPGTFHTHTQFTVNMVWAGGYPADCKWYDAFNAAQGVEPVPFVTSALALLFGVLAVAVKITVVERLPELAMGGGQGDPPGAAPREPEASAQRDGG